MTVKRSSHSQSLQSKLHNLYNIYTVELNKQESKSLSYKAITFIQSRIASYFTAQRFHNCAAYFHNYY